MLPEVEQSAIRHNQQESYSTGVYEEIAAIMDAMLIDPNAIRGSVAIIGPGGGFGELAIISADCCAPRPQIRQGITSVVAIEQYELRYIPFAPSQPPIELYPYQTLNTFVHGDARGRTFDWIFMLRISQLHTQVEDGLLEEIATILSPNGICVVSGENRALWEFQNTPHLDILYSTYLDQQNGGYPFSSHHMGFVATKT